MKNLFITIFTILSVASVGTYMSLPEKKSVVPIIYWVTDANPERVRQVEVFEKWQIDNGHLGPDGGPAVKVMVDTDNGGHKKIIQGVSGVAADVMDIGGNQLNYFKQMGFLENITEIAEEKGFSYKTTWPAISELLTEVNPETGLREQYLYPCNIGASALWVNKNAFTRLGLEPPSTLITIEEFEKLAKEFSKRANEGLKSKKFFISANIERSILARGEGVSMFNETMTSTNLLHPSYIESNKRYIRWINEDRILPSPSDMASFSSESGYGGGNIQLFMKGNFATTYTGRWGLIAMRRSGALDLDVIVPPHNGFPNTKAGTRAAAVYKGSKHKKEAYLFMEFLASREYSQTIIDGADAMPPLPESTKDDSYSKPAKYPSEWAVHDKCADFLAKYAIVSEDSPYVLGTVCERYEAKAYDKALNKLDSLENAYEEAHSLIEKEIQYNLEQNKALSKQYDEDLLLQAKIDEYRKAGKKVPLSWIKNPFYQRYYAAMGWLTEEGK